jgi:hypothetical protein
VVVGWGVSLSHGLCRQFSITEKCEQMFMIRQDSNLRSHCRAATGLGTQDDSLIWTKLKTEDVRLVQRFTNRLIHVGEYILLGFPFAPSTFHLSPQSVYTFVVDTAP